MNATRRLDQFVRQAPSKRAGGIIDWGLWIVAAWIFALLISLLLPAVSRSRAAPRRAQCTNNLKQIGLALHNYADRYGEFPPAYTVNEYGHPLHSWRTLILPFLDQEPLYRSIDLSKPWDDPANVKAYNAIPPVYLCSSMYGPSNHTLYLANVADGGVFLKRRSSAMADITDDPAGTLLVIEAPVDRSVHWMSPLDLDEALILSINPDSKTAHLGGVQALVCNGSVRFLSSNLSPETRRALMTIAGGETVDDD